MDVVKSMKKKYNDCRNCWSVPCLHIEIDKLVKDANGCQSLHKNWNLYASKTGTTKDELIVATLYSCGKDFAIKVGELIEKYGFEYRLEEIQKDKK